MSDRIEAPSERDEIEMLLPWYVTGRLSNDARRRVETWLAHDRELARQVALIEEERHEAAAAAEALTPSRRLTPASVLTKLPGPGLLARVAAWVDERVALISPVGARIAAAAALVLIVAQGVGTPDGLYRLRIGAADLDETTVKARIDLLKSDRRVFDLVLPEPRRRGSP